MSDFDRQIERELGRVLGPLRFASIPPWKAPLSRAAVRKVIGGTGAALSAKLVAGFAVAALAATGAEVSITGSIDPSTLSLQVEQQVADCKAALTPGVQGIGACVSDFARQRAQSASSQPQSSAPRVPSQQPSSRGPARDSGAQTRDRSRDGSTGWSGTGGWSGGGAWSGGDGSSGRDTRDRRR